MRKRLFTGRMVMIVGLVLGIRGVAYAESPGGVAGCVAVEYCAETAKLTGSMTLPNDHFGRSLAVHGDVMLVGTPDANCSQGPQCGEAYFFAWDGAAWSETARFTAPAPQNIGKYGWSVAVHGDLAVIGMPNQRCTSVFSNCGGAHVLRYDGVSWVPEAELRASDQEPGDEFGYAVAAGEDVILIGAPYQVGVAGLGAVYVFRYDGVGWVEDQRIDAPAGHETFRFGDSVALSGVAAVIGESNNKATTLVAHGAAYIYRDDGDNWQIEQTLLPDDLSDASQFGIAVGLDGTAAIVGASSRDCAAGSACGAAYVYRFDGALWNAEATLSAPDAATNDMFGAAVAVLGDRALIGASGDSCGSFGCGAAYVFGYALGVWSEEQKVLPAARQASAFFGISTALRADQLAVGATGDNCAAGMPCGAVFVYSFGATSADCDCDGVTDLCEVAVEGAVDCNDNSVQDDCDVADGTSPDCNANTDPDECDVAAGASTDVNGNGVPDECDTTLPPFIIEHPAGDEVCEGDDATFTVVAGGMPPFTYQWRHDGMDLTGETADTLVLMNVQATDGGDYDVVVSNDLGSVTSDPASLVVAADTDLILQPDPSGIPHTRFLTFVPPQIPCAAALRVVMVDLQTPNPPNHACCPPPNFGAYEAGTCAAAGELEGCARWVGQPRKYLEAQELPGYGNYWAARLQCTPHYQDWRGANPLSVTGAEIVPSSSYTVQAVSIHCLGNEANCAEVSTDLPISTPRAGDVVASFQSPEGPLNQPNAIDIVGVVNNFRKLTGAPKHVEAQVRPDLPNLNRDVDALDMQAVVANVKLGAYPFSGPCPCPSTVTCGTACSGSMPCFGGNLCMQTCSAGPRMGEFCTSNRHCGTCVGGSRDGIPCDSNAFCGTGSTCATGTCATQGYCRDRCGRCTP